MRTTTFRGWRRGRFFVYVHGLSPLLCERSLGYQRSIVTLVNYAAHIYYYCPGVDCMYIHLLMCGRVDYGQRMADRPATAHTGHRTYTILARSLPRALIPLFYFPRCCSTLTSAAHRSAPHDLGTLLANRPKHPLRSFVQRVAVEHFAIHNARRDENQLAPDRHFHR